MFPNPKILQQLFPYPNLNILKIWAWNELECQSYEKNVPPFPLTQYIVRQLNMKPLLNVFIIN